MVAKLGLHDAGVADLACLVVAPVLEGLDHVAVRDVLKQTACGAVVGLLVSQLCEGFLGGFTGQEVVQNGLGLCLGVQLGSLVGVLGEGDQDVADVGQPVAVIGLTQEVDHGVAVVEAAVAT